MHLKRLELNGFKSFAKHSEFVFDTPIIAIVGPNGSGKSNVVEAIRFVLGEQSVKSMRCKIGSDLIFKGSKNLAKMSRASVDIVFDNTDRVFHLHSNNNTRLNVDFDEVVISREVHSDGISKYMVNGHEVRMKDIHELIASVNIGASGHHIISQGDADRYLNANLKDRRELIEEALGLKIYQYRIKESLRKLDKSNENMRESEMLRRELAPHIRFLKRQMDKIQKSKDIRDDLVIRYKEYFAKEDNLIKKLKNLSDIEKIEIDKGFSKTEVFLKSHENPGNITKHKEENIIFEKKVFIQNWQEKISKNTLELGKVEGMISLLERQNSNNAKSESKEPKKHTGFSYEQVNQFFTKILKSLNILEASNITKIVTEIKRELDDFVSIENNDQTSKTTDAFNEITELERKKQVHIDAIKEAKSYIIEIESEITTLEENLSGKRKNEKESQKQYYEFITFKKELEGRLAIFNNNKQSIDKRIIDRDEEYKEALVLLGEQNIKYDDVSKNDLDISELSQEKSRREIERSKIRLEEIGGGSGSDVIKEHDETMERDLFLQKEIADINKTIMSLNEVISELKQTLNIEFETGIKKINIHFEDFFKLMFGGGSAVLESTLIKKRRKKSELENEDIELTLEDDDSEKEYGIDIKVKLPRKKVSDLDMLSGGERSITSIALLFALTQVNPPPFLVLDETDAALDEANSQKYGDVIESLSKFSQLILVTHNRETMSRAHTLFGVTLGRDDGSMMLSLRLEDATQYAK